MPVSWGPCCTRTILFLFLFFNVLVPVRTSCLSAFLSPSHFLSSSLPPFSSLFIARPSVHFFFVTFRQYTFLVPFSIGFLLYRTASSRRSSCSSGSSAPSLRLFSLVPSACPSRLLCEAIMYRIRYHLIAILGIEKSLVVTVPNTVCFRCENFHILFFQMKIFARLFLETFARRVCIENFNIGRVYFRDSGQKEERGNEKRMDKREKENRKEIKK